MFREFPADFRYVLGLQESVVVAMADGFAPGPGQRRAGQPAFRHRRRPCARQHLHRLPQSDAAGDHRRPAGALDTAVRAVSLFGTGARNCPSPTSNGASSRRGPPMCRPPSPAPTTWRCSRRADRRSYRFRWMIGTARASRLRAGAVSRLVARRSAAVAGAPAALLAGAPTGDRRRRLELRAMMPGTRPSRSPKHIEAAVWASPMSARNSFPEHHRLFAGFLPADRAGIVARLTAAIDPGARRARVHLPRRRHRSAHSRRRAAGATDRRSGAAALVRRGHFDRHQSETWRRSAAGRATRRQRCSAGAARAARAFRRAAPVFRPIA